MTKNFSIMMISLGAVLLSYTVFQAFGNPLKKGNDIGIQAENAEILTAFNVWKSKQNSLYGSPKEHQFRLSVFKQNYLTVKSLQKTANFSVELNHFADLTDEEFMVKHTGDMPTELEAALESTNQNKEDKVADQQNPGFGESQYLDWRDKGVVNPVQNQRNCGSCWAFSAIASFEGAYAIKYGKLLKFSESRLVDCNYQCNGCRSGFCEETFKYLTKSGTVLASDYPYIPQEMACDKSKIINPVRSTTYAYTYATSQPELKASVDIGPTYISIDSSPASFRFYKSGVYDSDECSKEKTHHSVTVIGYSIEGENDSYWIVRNAWGANWGDRGYILLKMFFKGPGQCYMYRRQGRSVFN